MENSTPPFSCKYHQNCWIFPSSYVSWSRSGLSSCGRWQTSQNLSQTDKTSTKHRHHPGKSEFVEDLQGSFRNKTLFRLAHTIHGTGMFTYIYHKHVVKYTSPMDGMGWGRVLNLSFSWQVLWTLHMLPKKLTQDQHPVTLHPDRRKDAEHIHGIRQHFDEIIGWIFVWTKK